MPVALVTGGGRGVGRVIACALADEGFAVGLTARTISELDDVVDEITAAGGSAVAHGGDATRHDDACAVAATVEQALGPIDLLVNNAGSAAAVGPSWQVDDASWWRDVETTLRGAFNYVQAILPGMLQRGSGRVVNVSSYSGTRPSPHMSGYAAAKAALVNFSESLAAETAGTGVKVFTITPGLFRSALTEHLMAPSSRTWIPEVGTSGWVEPERVATLARLVASGRLDALAGRFLHALDELDELVEHAEEIAAGDLLTLRLRRWPPDAR